VTRFGLLDGRRIGVIGIDSSVVADAAESIAASLGKRPPVFDGR
jgi:hypothetical protein